MQDGSNEGPARPAASIRTMDIVVALVLLIGSGLVIFDSVRLGIGWRDGWAGAGLLPFWVRSCWPPPVVNLVRALGAGRRRRHFRLATGLRQGAVGAVPSLIYVMLIGGLSFGPIELPGLGIYVASALFIAGFMVGIRRRKPLRRSRCRDRRAAVHCS